MPEQFWEMSVPEIVDVMESAERVKEEALRRDVNLAFVQASANSSRIGFILTDPKKRREKDILQPWDVFPSLFEQSKEKRESAVDEQMMALHKAQMQAVAAKWNKRRKEEQEHGEHR